MLAAASLLLVIVRMTLTLRDVRQGSVNFQDARTDELTGLVEPARLPGGDQRQPGGATPDSAPRRAARRPERLQGDQRHARPLIGDELLTIVAKRFASWLGSRGTIARIGGDEFAMTFDVEASGDAVEIAQQLARHPFGSDHARRRHGAGGRELSASPCSRRTALTPLQLLRSADVAMYEAKTSRRTICAYRSEHDRTAAGRLALVGDLRTTRSSRRPRSCTSSRRATSTPARSAASRRSCAGGIPTLGLLYSRTTSFPMAERVGMIRALPLGGRAQGRHRGGATRCGRASACR